jgi:hypothetical protein
MPTFSAGAIMSRQLRSRFALATVVVVGAGVAVCLGGASRAPQIPPTRVAAADGLILHSIEGGVQASGYIDGRPVPSGLKMPIVIRWKPRDQTIPVDKGAETRASLLPAQ